MNRRSLVEIVCMAALCVGVLRSALAIEPQEGRDYSRVVPALPADDSTKVIVTEFFSYACPHCFGFAPALSAWEAQLPTDVALNRVAVTIGRAPWVLPAQLFYALRSIGKERELDKAVFDAIHVEHVGFETVRETVDWVAARGVARGEFEAALGAFSIKSFVARGDQLARAAQVRAVPTLVIDGKYRVEIDEGGDLAGQLAVVDALVVKARTERGNQ